MPEKEKRPRPDEQQQDHNRKKEEPHRPDVKKPEGTGASSDGAGSGGDSLGVTRRGEE